MKPYRWQGLYYNSNETCLLTYSDAGIVIKSFIIGNHDSVDFRCDYRIHTNRSWETVSFEIDYALNGVTQKITGSHGPAGWLLNNESREEFRNCIDMDITLTPFTNSLPINWLSLSLSKPQQIDVLYIDVLENTIRPARQQYTRLSETLYNFQNVPNDFEANIQVDSEGFVVHYPNLFNRINP